MEYGALTPNLSCRGCEESQERLHQLFEWDDAKAGESFRVAQARAIITSVKVNIITETRKISAVSYVRDPRLASDQQGYISVGTLKTDKDLAKESIKYEFHRAYAHLHRAKTHAEILGMEDQVSALLNSLEEVMV
jgi:hypothetical protein